MAIDATIDKLREDVGYIPFAVGASNWTIGNGAAKLANASNASRAIEKAKDAYDKAAELVSGSQEMADVFPSLTIDRVGLFTMLASPFNTDAGDVVETAREMIPLIDNFKETLDKWDVMSAFEDVWQNRAALCQTVGLGREAKACMEVASQYDTAYFEALDNTWYNPAHQAKEPSPTA